MATSLHVRETLSDWRVAWLSRQLEGADLMRRMISIVCTSISLAVFPGYAQEEIDPRFFCDAENRFLSDKEFLDIAFAHEVERYDLPEPFLSLGVDGMRELDPGCCSVLREDNPGLENTGWLSWLLFDPYVYVGIGWDLDPNHGANNSTGYDITICGRLMERRGDFRKRDYVNKQDHKSN